MPNNLLMRSLWVGALCLAFSTSSYAEERSSAAADGTADDYYAESYGAEAPAANDPFEPVNRGIFRFNELVDKGFIRPIAKGYTVIVPEYGRDRVHHVLTNLGEPVVMLNGFLQGNPKRGFTAFWRFILNSTFGVLGIFDFAGANFGLNHESEDFGQTMGVYGVGSGPYLIVPVFGSSSARDLFGRVVDVFSDPFTYAENYTNAESLPYIRAGLTVLDTRSRNLELLDQIYENSLDPYATIRSAYFQRREALVRNNQPRDHSVGY